MFKVILKSYSDVNFNDFYDDENNYTDWFSYANNYPQNILDEIYEILREEREQLLKMYSKDN